MVSDDHDAHCWVIRRTKASDVDLDDDFTPHYTSRDQAIAAVSDLEDIPVRLPEHCYVHTCDACQEDLTDEEAGGVVHWLSYADAAREARHAQWTSDGRDWHCPGCPELTDALAEFADDAAREPGPADQMLPGLAITKSDVQVLGAVGVLPQQAVSGSDLGDTDEDQADGLD